MVATLWPFGPNIRRSPYVVTREFRTDIIVSRAGREQRRALRQTPRKRVEYLTAQTEACLRAFDRSMVTAQRTLLAVPERVRFVVLAAGLGGGATTVIIDPVPAWIVEGAELILSAPGRSAIRTVVDITGTTVTFDEFEAEAWPSDTRLHPSLNGYLEATIPAPLVAFGRGVVEASISFAVNPGTEVSEDEGAAIDTFSGREVFLKQPNVWSAVEINRVQEGAAVIDYGFGAVAHFFPIDFSTRIWTAQYTACDFDHAEELRQFFTRMKGRQHEFYMPTWQEDLVPVLALTAAGTTLTVAGEDVDAVFSNDTIVNTIAVKLTNGNWIFRSVTSIATNTGDISVLTVNAAWGQDVALNEIEMVCWMPVWRLSSDILTMTWPMEDVAQTSLPMQMIENLAVE